MTTTTLPALTDLLRRAGLHTELHGADSSSATVVVHLPHTDALCLLADTTTPGRLRWVCEDMYGEPVDGHSGDLAADGPAAIVEFVAGHAAAHTASVIALPDYAQVLLAFTGLGLPAQLEPDAGSGWRIWLDLPDGTQLMVGAPQDLPARLTDVPGWSVVHRSVAGHPTNLVYHSAPGGPHATHGADHAALLTIVGEYVTACQAGKAVTLRPVPPCLATARELAVWLLRHWDRHGDDVTAYASEAGAMAALAESVRARWANITGRYDDVPASGNELPDRQAVDLYFDVRGEGTDEGYSISEVSICGSVIPGLPYGLSADETETLVRLAARAAAEADNEGCGDGYGQALRTFDDPAAVHAHATGTWHRITDTAR